MTSTHQPSLADTPHEDVLVVDPRPDDDAPPAASAPSHRWVLPVEILGVAVAPVVVFYLLQVEPYFRQNGLDPFMYLGYAQRPADLIDRFGLTYYSVRFGLLWPIELTTKLFGVTGGYFVLRWFLGVLGAGAVYAFFRSRDHRGIGAAVALLYLSSPVVLRAVMTSYSDTIGVPFLIAAFAILLMAVRSPRRAWLLALAGLLLGVAVNANPFIVAIAGCFLVAWGVCELPTRRWRILADAAIVGGGVVGVTVVGMVVYQLRYGDWNILSASLDAAQKFSGEAGKNFRSPTRQWLAYQLPLYLPLLVLVTWAAGWLSNRRKVPREHLVVLLSIVLTGGFFAVNQFAQDGTALETYYYSSYLAPVTLLGLGMVMLLLWDRFDHGRWLLAAAPVAVLALPFARDELWTGFVVSRMPWVPILVAATAVTALLASRHVRLALLAVLVLIASTWALLLGSPRSMPKGSLYKPDFDLAIGDPNWTGMDLYKLSYDLMAFTPPIDDDRRGNVMFWYDPVRSPIIASVHGAFVAYNSNVQVTSPGMPVLDAWRLQWINNNDATRLVLLGQTDAEVDEGIAALRAVGATVGIQRTAVLTSGPYRIRATLISYQSPPGY